MRAIVLLLVLAAPMLLIAPAAAHAPVRCEPAFVFPTFAIWNVPAGGTSSFFLPANYFGSLVASLPIDLSMFRYSTCEPDASCHHHGLVGPFLCGSTPAAVVEIHNPNGMAVPVELAVGMCLDHAVCDSI